MPHSPGNLPFALGVSAVDAIPPKDIAELLTLAVSLLGLVASLAFVWKMGKIVNTLLKSTSTLEAPEVALTQVSTPASPEARPAEDGDAPDQALAPSAVGTQTARQARAFRALEEEDSERSERCSQEDRPTSNNSL